MNETKPTIRRMMQVLIHPALAELIFGEEGKSHTVAYICEEYKISRSTYYRYRKLYTTYGKSAHLVLRDRRLGRTPRKFESYENLLLKLIAETPRLGPKRLRNEFRARLLSYGIEWNSSATQMYNFLLRNGLQKDKYRYRYAKFCSDFFAGVKAEEAMVRKRDRAIVLVTKRDFVQLLEDWKQQLKKKQND